MPHHTGEKPLDAAAIAIQLQETEPGVLIQISRILERMGSEFVQTVLTDTLRLKAEGGMLTEDKQRRRTPGGVLFYLVRGRVSPEDRKALFLIPGVQTNPYSRLPLLFTIHS